MEGHLSQGQCDGGWVTYPRDNLIDGGTLIPGTIAKQQLCLAYWFLTMKYGASFSKESNLLFNKHVVSVHIGSFDTDLKILPLTSHNLWPTSRCFNVVQYFAIGLFVPPPFRQLSLKENRIDLPLPDTFRAIKLRGMRMNRDK